MHFKEYGYLIRRGDFPKNSWKVAWLDVIAKHCKNITNINVSLRINSVLMVSIFRQHSIIGTHFWSLFDYLALILSFLKPVVAYGPLKGLYLMCVLSSRDLQYNLTIWNYLHNKTIWSLLAQTPCHEIRQTTPVRFLEPIM